MLLAIFLLGIIIAFEFSLLDFSGRLKDLGLKKTDEESVGDLDNNDSVDLSLDPIVEMTKDDHGKEVRHAELDNEEVDGNSNIGNIKFIDDDDETYSGPDDKNSSDETGESVASASSSFFKKQPVQKISYSKSFI